MYVPKIHWDMLQNLSRFNGAMEAAIRTTDPFQASSTTSFAAHIRLRNQGATPKIEYVRAVDSACLVEVCVLTRAWCCFGLLDNAGGDPHDNCVFNDTHFIVGIPV